MSTFTPVDEAIRVINEHTTDLGREGHYCMCGAGPFRSFNGQRKHEGTRRRRAFAALPMDVTPADVLRLAAH